MRKVNYDRFPSTKIAGMLVQGWSDIRGLLAAGLDAAKVLAVEFYTGVREEEVLEELSMLKPSLLIDTRDLMKSEDKIKAMTERFMTDDVLFGYVTNLSLTDYFDADKLEAARRKVAASDRALVVETGAALGAYAFTLQQIDSNV